MDRHCVLAEYEASAQAAEESVGRWATYESALAQLGGELAPFCLYGVRDDGEVYPVYVTMHAENSTRYSDLEGVMEATRINWELAAGPEGRSVPRPPLTYPSDLVDALFAADEPGDRPDKQSVLDSIVVIRGEAKPFGLCTLDDVRALEQACRQQAERAHRLARAWEQQGHQRSASAN